MKIKLHFQSNYRTSATEISEIMMNDIYWEMLG